MIGISVENVLGVRRLELALATLESPDFSSLMESWGRIGLEDNRSGVMSGTDGDGDPMIQTIYRNSRASAVPYRQPALWGKRTERTSRQFRSVSLPNDNLPTSVYRKLTGPPLAPRGLQSRVIRKHRFATGHDGRTWWTEFFWDNVVNAKGRPFLHYHFEGIGQVRRDLRGLRPDGWTRARLAFENWLRLELEDQIQRRAMGA